MGQRRTESFPASNQSTGKHCHLLLPLLLLLSIGGSMGFSPRLVSQGDAPFQTVFWRYTIDRSAVPDWVTFRDLTLRIDVGSVQAVWAWGDGQPLAVRRDAEAGVVVVTTAASELLLALQGEDLDGLGGYTVATLKDDKLWAYSLTFDDGLYSVYQYAWPELQRYDYRAGVAVIGWWLDREDALENGYCSANELSELLEAGWSIFNHSYRSFNAPSDITFEEAWLCQEAIRNNLAGYQATVFTVPFANPLWEQVIDDNAQELGLYLMQLRSDGAGPIQLVDDDVVLTQGTYHLNRRDIKQWVREDSFNYFDQAHWLATDDPPQHAWVTLHGHEVLYDQDWCAVAYSASYLYHTYGAGGTDEVWMAPADEVFQYLVVRSYAQVSRSEGTPRDLGEPVRGDTAIFYRQGSDGYTGWDDTYIQEWSPTANYASQHSMLLRGGEGGRSTLLLRMDVAPPDEEAIVLDATLSLYATSHTNPAEVDLTVYPLLREWNPAQVTWNNALRDVAWELAGARAVGVDRGGEPGDVVHVGDCPEGERWYAFDVTEFVAHWLAHPDEDCGLLIAGDDRVAKGSYFSSSDHPYVSLRPVLRVLYGWPMIEPTPTALPTVPSPTCTLPPTVSPSPTPHITRINLPLIFQSLS